jgi:hypothetical protein
MKVSSFALPEDLTIRQARLFPGLGPNEKAFRDCMRSLLLPEPDCLSADALAVDLRA